MKYEVTMSCGHKKTVELFGKTEDREKKIKWLENWGLCSKCREEEEMEKAKDLPPLTGTEKQVRWAIQIRNKMLDKLTVKDTARYTKEAMSQYNHFLDWLKNKTEAKYWIDHNDAYIREILMEYKKETTNK